MTEKADNNIILERYLSASYGESMMRTSELISHLKNMIKKEQIEDAKYLLSRAIQPTLDYTTALSFYRIYRKIRDKTPPPDECLQLAVLGGFTTTQLTQFMELNLFAFGISVNVFESEYGVFRQEILNPNSELYKFKPKIIWLL